MSQFTFKEIDQEGEHTLDVISEAVDFNSWMYDTVSKHCSGRILEIGSGIGNISGFFLKRNADITLSDIRENYCAVLREKFDNVREVIRMDLTHPKFEEEYKNYLGQFDCVFALNVVEHIREDGIAIGNCFKLLKAGGKVVILVPAYQRLYNRFDVELEHFRRYNRESLNKLLNESNFIVVHSQYFNFMGIFGWFVSGKLMKNKTIPKGQMSLYNALVPVIKMVDKIVMNRWGLSVISVGQKR